MAAQATLHPTDQTLHAYGLGRLDDASAGSVNAHLEGCPDCRRRVAELSSDSFLGRIRDAGVPRQDPAVSATDGLSVLDADTAAPSPPPASTLPPGLADHRDYQIVRELGRGGMGVVYLAQNTLMGRLEVLKVVGGHLVSRPAILERFLREIRSAARLHHPNIVTAYSAIRLGEGLVLAMEYVEGLDLARLVKTKGPLPVANACNYIHQAALGLEHAHEHGMVHRDIKPANLILARAGNKAIVKVLDFGLAKVTSEGQRDSGLTREGQMLGTPDFIAPEQIRDAQSADIRADIYSLGCTLYYLLSGGPPFKGDHLWDIYQAHFSLDAPPLNLVRPEVPVELAALLAKMMAKDPGRRFQEPKEVAQALKPFFKAGSTASVTEKPDVSKAGRTIADRGAPATGTAPTRPMTEPPPAVAARKTAEKTQPQPAWDSLIDLRETDPLHDSPAQAPAPAARIQPARGSTATFAGLGGRVPGGRWAIAGVLLLGFAVALAGVLRVKTRDGVIVLENLPEDAEVYVDGGKVAVTWPDGGVPAEITILPGKHRVQVKTAGFTTSGDEVTVDAGQRRGLRVRLERPAVEQTASDERGHTIPPRDPRPTGPVDRTRFAASAGRWKVDGNDLLQLDATKADCALMFGDERWTDYDFSVEVMRTGGRNSFSLFFRTTGYLDGYEYEVAGVGNTTCRGNAWEQRHVRTLEKGFQHSLDDFKWYTAFVHVRGDRFYCSLYDNASGRTVGRFDVVDDRHPRGRVGLGTWLLTFRFRNIKVTDPDGHPLWDGPPAVASPTSTDLAGTVEGHQEEKASADADRRENAGDGPLMVDLLQPGSVWTADPGNHRFTVLERRGERFRSRFEVGNQVREVSGTIRDGRLRWLARDVKAVVGRPGGDNEGEIRGREIAMTWSDPAGPGRGRFTLRLAQPAPAAPGGAGSLAATAAGGGGFVPLFNGTDLRGWRVEGGDPGAWSVEDGAIVARGRGFGTRGYLLTHHEYADFTLRLEFDPEAGSGGGLAIRAIPGEELPLPGGNRIYDHPLLKLIGPPGKEVTGMTHWVLAAMRVNPSRRAEMAPAGSWNRMEVEVRGQTMRASVNGRPLLNIRLDPDARFPDGTVPGLVRARGRIGLQKHTGTVRFRNIQIRQRNE